jgi:hypothetical protein
VRGAAVVPAHTESAGQAAEVDEGDPWPGADRAFLDWAVQRGMAPVRAESLLHWAKIADACLCLRQDTNLMEASEDDLRVLLDRSWARAAAVDVRIAIDSFMAFLADGGFLAHHALGIEVPSACRIDPPAELSVGDWWRGGAVVG